MALRENFIRLKKAEVEFMEISSTNPRNGDCDWEECEREIGELVSDIKTEIFKLINNTPRVDNEAEDANYFEGANVVSAVFARTLEIELNKAYFRIYDLEHFLRNIGASASSDGLTKP